MGALSPHGNLCLSTQGECCNEEDGSGVAHDEHAGDCGRSGLKHGNAISA